MSLGVVLLYVVVGGVWLALAAGYLRNWFRARRSGRWPGRGRRLPALLFGLIGMALIVAMDLVRRAT